MMRTNPHAQDGQSGNNRERVKSFTVEASFLQVACQLLHRARLQPEAKAKRLSDEEGGLGMGAEAG